MKSSAHVHQASAERDSVFNLTPIGDYREDLGGFTRVDGAHVVLADVTPYAGFDRPDSILEANSEALAQGLSAMSTGTTVHATWWLSKNIDASIDAYRRMGGEDIPILKSMEDARVELMKGGADQPLLKLAGGRGFYTRRLRIVVGITVWPTDDERMSLVNGLQASILPGHPARERAERIRKAIARRAREMWEVLAGKFSMIGCGVTPLNGEDYIRVTRELLYPRTGYQSPMNQDTWLPLYMRVPTGEVISDTARGTVEADGVVMRCATLRGNPKESFPGVFSLPNAKLGGATLLDFLDQGHITISATARDKNKTRFLLQQIQLNIQGGMAMPGREAQASEDAARALQWIEAENRKMFNVELVAVTYDAKAEKADDRIRQLKERLSEVSAFFLVEGLAAPSFILRSLPGGSELPLEHAHRDNLWADRQIADALPVAYRHRGTQEGLTLFHGVNGEPFPFSLWGGTSQGFVISGRPGQGKTFLAECLLWDVLRVPNSQAIIIDTGKSYLAMTLAFKERGVYKDLSKGLGRINPLEGSWDQAGPFALNFLPTLMTRRGTTPLSETQLGLLSENLHIVFTQREQRRTFNNLQELQGGIAKRAYLASALKRLQTAFVSAEAQKLMATLGKADTVIKVWYRYVIVSYQVPSQMDDKVMETHEVNSQQDLDEELKKQLRGLSFDLDTVATTTGSSCIALHANPDLSDILSEKGIHAVLDQGNCEVDLTSEDDVQIAEKSGVVFKVPSEVIAQAAAAIRDEILADPAIKNHDAAVIDRVVSRRITEAGGLLAYRGTLGHAVIQNEVTMGDLGQRLEEEASDDAKDIVELLNRLKPFYGDGPYAKYFDGSTTISLAGTKILDIELADLANKVDEHIFSAIFAALIQYLNIYIQAPENKHRRKVIIVEEAWQLIRESKNQPGTSTVVGDAIVNLLRTGRKHGVATGIVTQNITDLTVTNTGKQILENAPIKLIFRQAESAMAGAAESLTLSREQAEIMAHVRSDPGHYSQMVIIAPEHTPPVFEAVMLIPHPIQYWLNTTKPEDVTFRERMTDRLIQEGVPESEARSRVIQTCATQYPHGYRV